MAGSATLTEVVTLLTANGVDFSVEHGWHKVSEVETRSAMTIHFNNVPAVRIEFGATKHGSRSSRIHVDGDHKNVLSLDEVIRLAQAHRLERPWNTSDTLEKRAARA